MRQNKVWVLNGEKVPAGTEGAEHITVDAWRRRKKSKNTVSKTINNKAPILSKANTSASFSGNHIDGNITETDLGRAGKDWEEILTCDKGVYNWDVLGRISPDLGMGRLLTDDELASDGDIGGISSDLDMSMFFSRDNEVEDDGKQ